MHSSFFAADPQHHPYYFVRLLLGLLAGIGFIALLQLVPPSQRRRVIALFTFIGGALYAAEFFWPVHSFKDVLTGYLPVAGTISTVLLATAAGLGIFSLLGLHARTVARRREGWGYSAVLVVAFFAMLFWGIANAYYAKSVVMPQLPGMHAPVTNADMYNLLFYGGFAPLNASMFALVGFFIVSASYRAFRLRSLESSLLMGSALIVMLGQVTLGTAITNKLPTVGPLANLRLENLAAYILVQINTPAFRAIDFGIGVGFLATSLRLWLSLERGVYFDSEL